ncbi:hypothetical protein KCQ60_25065, partial [Mycobacterium tuberculosis]|nr:hypothetical protein [Mycobacterium tuberculosis]
ADTGGLPPDSGGTAIGFGSPLCGVPPTGGLDSVGLCGRGPSAGPGAGLPEGAGAGRPGSGGLASGALTSGGLTSGALTSGGLIDGG